MELLHKFKENGYFTVDLYYLLSKKKLVNTEEAIIPSQYEKEMRLSPPERLQTLTKIEVSNIVTSDAEVSPDRIVLAFTPRIVIFQNFRPNEKVVAKFTVKNISKGPTLLDCLYKESSHFSVKPKFPELLSRLAPGISVTFIVTFVSNSLEDYVHKVNFYTGRDTYVLPLIAMGPRPVFDFPDNIVIPAVPLKVDNEVSVIIRNVGIRAAGFRFQTRTPFSVYPKTIYLEPNEKIEVKVKFKTMRLGKVEGYLNALFETGENFQICLTGTTYPVKVELEKDVVRFSETYCTVVRQQTFKITNKSSQLLTYMCMKNSHVYYDFEEKVNLAKVFHNLKESESAKCQNLVHYDVLSCDEHERVYTRIFYDQIYSLVADETLYFQDTHFLITPVKGNLWPDKITEFTISFKPQAIGEFKAIAFLDIDGSVDRIPLTMVGTSLPPSIHLNLETLDMDCVYINKVYNYEVVVFNKGFINGVVVYKEVPPLFGSHITCLPALHCLCPGDREIFVITFWNSNQGPYFEEINFVIRGTDVVLKLYLKGEVIYPSLMFSKPSLDFGEVSVGVSKTLELEVINESIVHVNASVKISSDGPEESSIQLIDYAVADRPKPKIPRWPREFDIKPCKIDLPPQSRVSIKVTLTANLIRANQTSLELELDKSDSPPIVLPVTFNASVPLVTRAPDINIRACFVDYPYKHIITLESDRFHGYFTVEEQNEEETLKVAFEILEGKIEPFSTICLPVSIITRVLGVQEHTIRLNLFGQSKPIEICHVVGCGVRPIVTCLPQALHWGQVKLLNKFKKSLTLVNDSPVIVKFKASLLYRDGPWIIDPTEGILEAEGETDLFLSLYLIDADTYSNKAVIQLEKVKDILVPLTATGVGTSIVVGEDRDKISLGRHFTRIPLKTEVILENCGSRLHVLEWNENYKAPKTQTMTVGLFNLEPRVFKMAAGEKIAMTVTAMSNKVTTIKEMWYLVGSVEGINKKELLLQCLIIAEFVDPKIEVSATVIDFQYDYGPYSEFYKLTDIVSIKNVSKLPLDMEITVKPPFAIIQKQSTYKITLMEENLCCCITYNESDLNVALKDGSYHSKVFVDYLTQAPVEPLRKGPLNFFHDINKIKMAFNLTHTVEERLEDQETMKLQILFDTTKHLNLKSKVYSELMRNKFKGHKNKDTIKLIGKINFPNMFLMTPRVDFQCILNGSMESRIIHIQNLTPLLVCYKFQWKKCFISSIGTLELPNVEISEKEMELKSSPIIEADTIKSAGAIHKILDCPPVADTPAAGETKEEVIEEGMLKDAVLTASPPIDLKSDDLMSLSEVPQEDPNIKVLRKIAPMMTTDYDTPFPWISKFWKRTRDSNRIRTNEIFQVMPHRGVLKPNENQFVHILFTPKRNMNVRAILECEVLGGPPEYIVVTGQSSELMYTINSQKLNFKIRSFHEKATELLIIHNTAQLIFEYKTYLNEPKCENELEGTILDLVPPQNTLEPEEEAKIEIVMRPGVVGYFQRTFLLEVGHHPHIPIEVFGWGVIPQIHLSLPRPEIIDIHPLLGYSAIGTLTQDYLAAVGEIFTKGNSEHLNSPLTDKCFEDPDFQSNWHICSAWDMYPSTMDIELAIERLLVVNHIKLRPEILTAYFTTSKQGPIPGFQATPYLIDFGVVITGSTVQCVAEIVNYGPIVTKLHFSKGTCIPTWLSIKLCGKLNPGETGKLEVTFSPSSNDFTELEQNVETSFNLEVPYGITVPIKISALCAVPYLTTNVKCLDFGSVRCGDKIICSIPLKNVGKPTCIWFVTLRLKTPGHNPMMVLDSSGKYEPGKGDWLSIAFKPTTEMIYEGILIFRFHMNPKRMTIPVIGQGILPHVHIIGPNVSFPPTLPWAETTDIYFGLTNPCPFPLELIFAHSDEKWVEEDNVFQLLYKYYNKPNEMLVPAIRPGEGLPLQVMSFYKKFQERVKKSMEEEAAAAKANAKALAAAGKKPVRDKPIKAGKLSPKVTDKGDLAARKFRTETEIIADEIKQLKDNNVDPLKECLHVFDNDNVPTPTTDLHTKGIIVFFHGSPCEEEDGQEIAHRLGKKLSLPVVNIDSAVIQALCYSACPAKSIVSNAVNELYHQYHKTSRQDDDMDESNEDQFGDTEDEYEIMWKKIIYLNDNKNIQTPRSKTSDKKKKKSPASSTCSVQLQGVMGTTTMFHMDLIEELLTNFFAQRRFRRGFVVETLSSIILKNPPLALTTVLRCKNSIWNIHLILCQSDFASWAQAYEEALRDNELFDEAAAKVYSESEINLIVKECNYMDRINYACAPSEIKSIYITYGLEERRRKYYEKLGINYAEIKERNARAADRSKSLLLIISESKKKINKKDDFKAKPTNEYTLMSNRYTEYHKNTYEALVNIANNWVNQDGEVGFPLYGFTGQVIGTSQKKLKKKSEIQVQMSEMAFTERGFPLTLIKCPCQQYNKAVVDMFLNSPLVKEALKLDKEIDILKYPITRREFTVLMPKTMPLIIDEKPLKWCFLDELPIKKCECNQLTDLNLLDDTTQDNILNILSKWHCTCGRKVASSQTSTSEIPSLSVDKVNNNDSEIELYPCPLPLRAVKSITSPRSRLVLQPGDLVRCKYSFSPQVEGHFGVKRFVEVSGWPDSRVDINISGICDLPRLDSRPKKMFENFARRTIEDRVYKITYLDDLKVFEFGPIFIGANRVYEEEYTIDLKNSSLITAEVVIDFRDYTSVFQIDKTFIKLEPGCREKLTISAAPAEVGVHSIVLLFCVKDNPEIVTVNIACSGVVPILEILPPNKQIEYGKLLLYRRADDRFIVKNDSILSIMWKISNPEDFVEDFIISQTSGIVPRQDNQVVPITYIACRVGVISNKPLHINIYDADGRGDPMIIDVLHLFAECYDVMVECAYENPAENYLNYGNVKVNSTVLRDMYLLNRGKYNIYYKLKKVKHFPEPTLLKNIVATPESGVIPCAVKLVNIEFECTPTTSMNLVNVPAYTCSLLDGSKEQVVVAKFPICITIASFYNTFTLFPLGELNFNIIAVGSSVVREVILNNTSKCPVTYEIVVPAAYIDKASLMPLSAQKPTDNTKIKIPPIKCGNFLILNEDNLLAPGTSRTIPIQFMASAVRKFEETIKFIISDTCPAEANGVPLRLVGIGAMPTLDFWNIENTFREHLIVKSLSEYKVPESSPHCVFAENSVTLHFYCVNVNSSFTGVIDLYNNGFVPCALKMKLHYQHNSNEKIFSLDKYETHIESLQHKTLGIIFTPKALEEYRAVLEIKLKLLDNQEQSFKICLIGEGVIPRISMLSPPSHHHKVSLLQIPITCLGSVSSQKIRFKNISSVKCVVTICTQQAELEDRHVFWITAAEECDKMVTCGHKDEFNTRIKMRLKPKDTGIVNVHYSPMIKGKTSCEIKITILDNPYEYFTVFCDAEAFMEDVILMGLKMLSMDTDLEAVIQNSPDGTASTISADDTKKKGPVGDGKKPKLQDTKKNKRIGGSFSSGKPSDSSNQEPAVLIYVLELGGCELGVMQRRSVIMVNNSEKVYKFSWDEHEHMIVKPSVGYISPGEEKDLELMFFSAQPVVIKKELLSCLLTSIRDDSLTFDFKGTTWDNRQTVTVFDHNKDIFLNERIEEPLEEKDIAPSEMFTSVIKMIILYSAMTEYLKYTSTLEEYKTLKDTFIYQTRCFSFNVKNTGNVPVKLAWSFLIDEELPARIDKHLTIKQNKENKVSAEVDSYSLQRPDGAENDTKGIHQQDDLAHESKVTLFSGSQGRESVDTWFEIDLPFQIEPAKYCLKPKESKTFKVTFAPLDAFDYKVKLKSTIDNLDPYDQNMTCNITAKSLIPYVHLDIEESDYITSGRRKSTGVTLPPFLTVLEFNVLGSGCYKKTFNVINPSSDAYEFIFEMTLSDKPELIPMHCDMLKGYVEGGTSCEVTFTFAPTAPGVYESLWKFIIPVYNLVINLMVAGLVREPDVVFVPTILIIRNSLVGFTITDTVMLQNNETESLKFEFKGNSLCNESGKTPVVMDPEAGTLKPRSETPIKLIYTPIDDGPLSFKIYCSITYLTKYLTLCINALSHSIKPKVTYFLIGNEHVLHSEALTNIHLDQSASTYERKLNFVIKNDGSATFFFDWNYSASRVKKYLQIYVDPRSGHVAPGAEVPCVLHFNLRQVPVQAFPISLLISDGPEYNILLHSEIEKPLYHFTCTYYDFGKCIVHAPDTTYRKLIAFVNDDKEHITLDLNFATLPELLVEYHQLPTLAPKQRSRITIYFRPKQVKEYEFKIQFWVNSLCEEIIHIKGEGVPLLFDLYEGCQKSFDMGPVKVGHKIVRQIEVMNHSKVPIDATFIFKDMYPLVEDTLQSEATSVCLSPSAATVGGDAGPSRGQMLKNYEDDKIRKQIAMDIKNALSSLKVVPNRCTIKPYRKVPLKIQMKPVGLISKLDVQLNMRVLCFERPLVRLSGSATGMSLCLSQTSLQFGRVRKRGCKILKVMLQNKGDFGARFWWQPLISEEFVISPMHGNIAARTNVTFTITFRPHKDNPFIKVWASCNIENYMPLDLAMYATCVDVGNVQTKNIFIECPVREVRTDHVTVTNTTDELWLVLSELPAGPGSFTTWTEFNVEPNSVLDIPIYFKPKTMGKHEGQIFYSPLGDGALFVNLVGAAVHPNPNGTIAISVPAKDVYTLELLVHHITELPETYTVSTEIEKMVPDKFDGYFEIKFPDIVKVWGETAATCRWNFVCYDVCEMNLKVVFVNQKSQEYQFYNIAVIVTPSKIKDTMTFKCSARDTVSREILLTNPLATDAVFHIKCEKLDSPETIEINRQSEATLVMSYSPLVVGKCEEYVEITNELVGTFVYKMILECLPAKIKEIQVSTAIGTCVPIRLRVQNRTGDKAVFEATVSHASIIIEKEYFLPPYAKEKFLVRFEPTQLGEQHCTVSFNSPVAGEFKFNIIGTATAPKPQGPYKIHCNSFTTLMFKNVFMDTRTFQLTLDRQDFYVMNNVETLLPKAEVKVQVFLGEGRSGITIVPHDKAPTGCLTIECYDAVKTRIQWTYFLHGVP